MLRVNRVRSIILLLVISSISVLISCTSADKKSDEAEGAYAIAQEYDKEERYDYIIILIIQILIPFCIIDLRCGRFQFNPVSHSPMMSH